MNQSEEDGHSLLRALIFHGKMPAAGVKTLLRLYKTRTLRRSEDSIKTLIAVCAHYSLPDSSVENSHLESGGGASENEPGMVSLAVSAVFPSSSFSQLSSIVNATATLVEERHLPTLLSHLHLRCWWEAPVQVKFPLLVEKHLLNESYLSPGE